MENPAATPRWACPRWLEPYRRLIPCPEGMALEELMNLPGPYVPAQTFDAVYRLRAEAAIMLLRQLRAEGLLILEPRPGWEPADQAAGLRRLHGNIEPEEALASDRVSLREDGACRHLTTARNRLGHTVCLTCHHNLTTGLSAQAAEARLGDGAE